MRVAGRGDLPALTALQDSAQAGFDVRMPHSPPRRRWLLDRSGTTTWMLERAGTPVATARTHAGEDELLVAEAAAVDAPAAEELLRVLAVLAGGPPAGRAAHRDGDRGCLGVGRRPERLAEQYYVRVPDAAALLDRIRPVLWKRLVAAGLEGADGEILLSTFRRHYRIPVEGDGLGPVGAGGVMQAPGAARERAWRPTSWPPWCSVPG